MIAKTAAMVVNAQQISSSRILDSYQRRTPHSEEVGVSSEYHKEAVAMKGAEGKWPNKGQTGFIAKQIKGEQGLADLGLLVGSKLPQCRQLV